MQISIDKRINELQSDSSYSFKQTSEIIDIIYRIALKDVASNNDISIMQEVDDTDNADMIESLQQQVKELTAMLEDSRHELDNIKSTDDNISIFNDGKQNAYYEIFSKINDTDCDLLDIYIYLKEKLYIK